MTTVHRHRVIAVHRFLPFVAAAALLLGSPCTVDAGLSPCPWACGPKDDNIVSVGDLLELLSQWGTEGQCDVDGSGTVDVVDLLDLLANWGPCP